MVCQLFTKFPKFDESQIWCGRQTASQAMLVIVVSHPLKPAQHKTARTVGKLFGGSLDVVSPVWACRCSLTDISLHAVFVTLDCCLYFEPFHW